MHSRILENENRLCINNKTNKTLRFPPKTHAEAILLIEQQNREFEKALKNRSLSGLLLVLNQRKCRIWGMLSEGLIFCEAVRCSQARSVIQTHAFAFNSTAFQAHSHAHSLTHTLSLTNTHA
jgi:hypothetical protein